MMGPLARLLPYVLAFLSSLCIMVLELVASRLVAQHVGGSLIVWTSVIGIILAGICLGNVLGGRLADRIEPRLAVGPLFAIGSALTLACLWINAVVGYTPGLDAMPWNLRTVFVVTVDFLVPATVLGMIGPVVAKMAVERSQRAGSAIGDVYMLGAVGSIVGTFIAGFYLIYLAPTSVIVTLVAAALALLAASLIGSAPGVILGILSAGFLVGGSMLDLKLVGSVSNLPTVAVGTTSINAVTLAGHALTLLLALVAALRLLKAPRLEYAQVEPDLSDLDAGGSKTFGTKSTSLTDLAVLSFLISLGFMALEMTAGRMVQRQMGSSVYGWTSVIGVLLGGLSLGNYLGGKVADRIRGEKQASWLFLIASVFVALILIAETPPEWLEYPFEWKGDRPHPGPLAGGYGSFLAQVRDSGHPYTGHLSWWARVLVWTGVVFFLPAITMGTVSPVVAKLAVDRLRGAHRTGTAIGAVYAWGMVGSLAGTFLTGFFFIDWIGTKGMILALATMLALAATVLGSIWHAVWAGIPLGLCVIAFLPLPWLEERGVKWGIREKGGDPDTKEEGAFAYTDESQYYYIKVENSTRQDGSVTRTLVLDNLIHGYFILGHPEILDYDYEHIYALVTHRALKDKPQSSDPTAPEGTPMSTLFLGGGAYAFPRHLQAKYKGTTADIAEIDPAVTRANHIATGLPAPLPAGETDPRGIHTVWGDARQFVSRRHNGEKKYDIIYGDAFNDFSVPWHLTTRQFNDMLADMLTDDGVYMINIIDIYQSDANARRKAEKAIEEAGEDGAEDLPTPDEAVAEARKLGGFLSSWVETARLTFPHLYVFGTEAPGTGSRETFVVVASRKPIDLDELGLRSDDPQFYSRPKEFRPFGEEDMAALKIRSQGIILTDDYAPVENLLAPVAATRGE